MTIKSAPVSRLALAISLTTGYAVQSYGQEPTGTKPAKSVGALEEVVVIAQRREQQLIEVPISITALSADQLTRSGISSTADLERVTPGLEMTFNGGFLQPSIRGVSSAGSDGGDASNVAIYLDGVYMPSQAGQWMELPDAQQIEVLKGPQGTLYGQNATGGAIIITTYDPNMEEFEGKISASYGNYDALSLNGYVSGPIADMFAGSVAVAYTDRDGFRDDLVYGGNDKGLRYNLVRGKLLFQPSDKFDLKFTGYRSDFKDSSTYAGRAYNDDSISYIIYPNAPRPDEQETANSYPSDSDIQVGGGSIQAEFYLDIGTFSTTTAYSETDVNMYVDLDYGPASVADVRVNQSQDYFVQELNFASEQIGKWSFTTGIFFLSGEDKFDPNIFQIHNPPTLAPLPPGPVVRTSYTYGHIDKDIGAAFGEVNYDLTEKLQLSVGGRYSYEKQRTYGNPDSTSSVVVESPYSPESYSEFTPRVTLLYALTDSSNVYATYGEGFKSGLLSIAAFEDKPVDPEKLNAYEIGYKGDLTDSFSLTAAAYYYDYKDLQVARYEAPNYIYQNAASATIYGGELNSTWAATEGLTLTAGVSVLSAEYDDFPEAGVFVWDPTLSAGFPNPGQNYDASGDDMIRSPKVTGFLNADYKLYTSIGEFGVFGSAYYNDGYNLEVTGYVKQDSFTLLNAELSFIPTSLPDVRFVLWGRNLTDEDYLQSLLQNPFANGVSYADPRTYGARMEWTF